jgi:branched-chain amino acid transport system permease protein
MHDCLTLPLLRAGQSGGKFGVVSRRSLAGVGAFLTGFAVIALFGKVILPSASNTTAVPNGLYVQGIVVGLLSALLAIGLVLVYRSNRIINFAQGELGAFAATMAVALYQRFRLPFALAVATGLVAAVVTSLIIEFAVIRRFTKAPRLILTVATIGLAQILGAMELAFPALINRRAERSRLTVGFQSPLSFGFSFGGVRFRGDHLLVLIIAPLALIGLTFFFTYTRYGVAARAAAENEERARLLGVRVKRVSAIVWGLAGLLSALTAILRAPILGFQFGAIAGPGLLLRALAAGVIGRMESLPVTAAAAILLTLAEQMFFFSYGRAGPTDGFLLVVIVIALLAQRKRIGRVDPASSSWQAVQEIRPIPRELRRVPEVLALRFGGGGVLTAILIALPFVLSPSRTSLASVIFVYAIVGISLVVLTGWGGNVSLGQWAIAGVGGMIAGRLATQAVPQDFFVALLVGALCGTVLSLAIGLPALRIRGLFLGVTTLALAVAAESWILRFPQVTPTGAILRPVLFGVLDVASERRFYFVCLAGLLLALYMGRNLRRSRTGRVLIGLRDNEFQSQAFGVRVTRIRLAAFAISGFLAAFAGGLYAYHQQSIRSDRFPSEVSLFMFSMVVIGGMGSMTGAILGAVYVRGVQYFLPAELQLFATGFGLLVLLLVFPGGLGQVFFQFRDRILRWVANRRDLIVPSLVADRSEARVPGMALGTEALAEPAAVGSR